MLATVSNLYGYGPVDVPMTEDLPLAATGEKAQIRVRMWQDAKAANDAGRIRATEVRGSDYICPGAQSMLGDRVMPRILAGKSVQLLGDVDQPHSWTAPIDVARTLITVAADPRGWGRAWHVPSNAPRTQRQAVGDLAAAAGVPAVKVSTVPDRPAVGRSGCSSPSSASSRRPTTSASAPTCSTTRPRARRSGSSPPRGPTSSAEWSSTTARQSPQSRSPTQSWSQNGSA